MSSSPARYTEDQHASIRSLYAKYRNVRRVAEAVGCSQDTVRRTVDPKFAARRLRAQRDAYNKTRLRQTIRRSPGNMSGAQISARSRSSNSDICSGPFSAAKA